MTQTTKFKVSWIVSGPDKIFIGPFKSKSEAADFLAQAQKGNRPKGWKVHALIPPSDPSVAKGK